MRKKLLSRIMAVMLALMMVMGMSVTVMADTGVSGDGSTAIESVNVTVYVKTDGNTYQPNTSFSLSVATGSAGTYDEQTVYAGEEGGLSANTVASFTYSDAGSLTVSSSYSATATLSIDATKFSHTGIYAYTVTEASNSYDGVTVDSTSYTVYLYVYQNSDGDYYVGYVVSTKDNTKADLTFTNDYGADSSKGTGDSDGSTHDVTISKTVAGDMADSNKEFTFTVKVTAASGASSEAYKIVVKETSSSEASSTQTYMTSGDTGVTVTLKATGSVQIYGLSEGDTVAVTETDYSSDGYTTSTTVDGLTDSDTTNLGVSGSLTKDGSTIAYTNTKNATTPTGLLLTYGPYALMVIIALAACMVFFRRRRPTLD